MSRAETADALGVIRDLRFASLLSRHEQAMVKELVMDGSSGVIATLCKIGDEMDWTLLQSLRDEAAEASYYHFKRVLCGPDGDLCDAASVCSMGDFLSLRVVLDACGAPQYCAVYDLRCGAGENLLNACFARDFSAAVGIDDDEEAISQARARAFEIDASTRRTLGMGKLTLEFVCGSFPNIDWSAAGVALCDCEGMDDQAIGALARRARLLAPGSVLVCLGRPCFDDALATAFAGRARIGGRNRDVYAMRRTAGDGSSPGATAEDTAGSSTTPASESSGPRRWAIDEAAAAAATAATSSTPVGVAGAATTGGAAPSLRIPERVARLQRRHRRPNGAHDARGRQAQQQGQVPGESMATPKGSIPAVTRLNADAQAVRANTPMAVWKRLAAVRTDVGLPPSSPQGSALLDRKRGHGGGAHGDVGRVPSFGDSEDSSGDSERGVMRLVSGDLVGASSPGLGHGAEDDGEEEEEEETGEESSKGDDADGFPADDGPAEVAGTHEPAVRPARHSFMSVASAESVGSVEQEARRRVAPTAGADTAGRARLGSDGATGETAAPQRRFSQPDSRPPPPPSLHLGQRSNAAASPHGHQRVAALRAGAEKKEPSSPLDDKLLLRKHRGPKR